MHTKPAEFAALLDAAADDIGRQKRHPGQSLPGVWKVGGANSPERLIGLVASAALARISRERGVDFDQALTSYVEVSRNISLVPKGGPDVIAAQHLRDAATEMRRVAEGGEPGKAV